MKKERIKERKNGLYKPNNEGRKEQTKKEVFIA